MTSISADPTTVPALPDLPAGFLWGAATAAYQIEGGVGEGGRGESIWDEFCRRPGAIADGSSGAVACDSFHRWRDDVELLAGLGLDAYRFSVAWPRVLPNGRGPVNRAGLDYYDRLVDALCERGIRPFVTLYHWDLPQALEDRGGWRVRDTAESFAEYAAVVAGALGDRVQDWITLNEPYCSSIVGYAEGRHAPGRTEGHGALAAAHHLLVGHGLATAAIRAAAPRARAGITLNLSPAVAASDSAADRAAAHRQNLMLNLQFTDPVLAGRYPDGFEDLYAGVSDLSFRRDGDLALISAPLDFLGVNYYYRVHVADAPVRQSDPASRSAYDIGVRQLPAPAGVRATDLGWPVEPEGMYDTLVGLADRYPGLPPIYVTENGCAELREDLVPDPERISYVAEHLDAVARAAADDDRLDLRGYFYWSLIDNFEWARGYGPRFGLAHVDYATGVRTPKASYHWLREQIAAWRGHTSR